MHSIVGLLSIIISFALNKKGSGLISYIWTAPIILFLSLRYGYGNDYYPYLDMFNVISNLNLTDYTDSDLHAETGWVLLNYAFKGVGFFAMIMVVSFASSLIIANYFSRYVPNNYHWVAVFLFVFFPDNMLIQSSAMRQSVAIIFFIVATKFLIDKKFFLFLLLITAASLFHSSAIFLLPLVLLGFNNFSIKRRQIPAFLILYFLLFFISGSILESALGFLNSTGITVRYDSYDEGKSLSTGLGAIFFALILSLLVFYHDNQDHAGKLFFKFSIIGVFLIPFGVDLSMVARLIFYFNAASLVSIPLLFYSIKDNLFRSVFFILYSAFVIYSYLSFFASPVWQDGFSNYKTIFSAPIFY